MILIHLSSYNETPTIELTNKPTVLSACVWRRASTKHLHLPGASRQHAVIKRSN